MSPFLAPILQQCTKSAVLDAITMLDAVTKQSSSHCNGLLRLSIHHYVPVSQVMVRHQQMSFAR